MAAHAAVGDTPFWLHRRVNLSLNMAVISFLYKLSKVSTCWLCELSRIGKSGIDKLGLLGYNGVILQRITCEGLKSACISSVGTVLLVSKISIAQKCAAVNSMGRKRERSLFCDEGGVRI